MTLTFSFKNKRNCVNVTIVNDSDDEQDESFYYTIEMTHGLGIEIRLADGEVVIEDDEG